MNTDPPCRPEPSPLFWVLSCDSEPSPVILSHPVILSGAKNQGAAATSFVWGSYPEESKG
jgi:hypothetical protein